MFNYIYYLAMLIGPIMGIYGFMNGLPWFGAASFLVTMVGDIVLPLDFKHRPVAKPILLKLPMYFILIVLMPMLYASFFYYMYLQTTANTLTAMAAVWSVLSLVWLGMFPNLPAFHELGHGKSRFDRFMGDLGAAFLGNSARMWYHVHHHHIHAGSKLDNNTPERGASLYKHIVRANIRNWSELIRMDRELLKGKGFFGIFQSRAVQSLIITHAAVAATYFGIGWIAALSLWVAQVLGWHMVEALNYHQHYGLIRPQEAEYEARHNWNHYHMAMRAMNCDVTNHSQHHMKGDRPFWENVPDPNTPQLPPATVCLLASFVPPLWDGLITKRKLKEWDFKYANEAERKLAREANRQAGWEDWFSEQGNQQAVPA